MMREFGTVRIFHFSHFSTFSGGSALDNLNLLCVMWNTVLT